MYGQGHLREESSWDSVSEKQVDLISLQGLEQYFPIEMYEMMEISSICTIRISSNEHLKYDQLD